ncbi:hypothetical protein DPMN_075050 [Dreissena polymorpha]|uniref:Uncharacterized protein n=1 Tax=Dreissena polymorpha TaxID=45954 RepID=A0A9D4BP10_DREPO|nr:hypothetical protein DPMN_075050 [Dreissena polymorpha]
MISNLLPPNRWTKCSNVVTITCVLRPGRDTAAKQHLLLLRLLPRLHIHMAEGWSGVQQWPCALPWVSTERRSGQLCLQSNQSRTSIYFVEQFGRNNQRAV